MGIYIFSGNEPYKIDAYKHRLLKDAENPEMNIQMFYKDFDKDVHDSCVTSPFLASKRFVVLDIDTLKPLDGKLFTEYRKNPCPTTDLVIISRQADMRLKITKALIKEGLLTVCDKVSSQQELEKILVLELKKRGAVINGPALKEFTKRLNYFGLEYMTITQMLGYLHGLADITDHITLDVVEKFIPSFDKGDRFILADLIKKQDMTELLRQLNMLNIKDSSDAIGILSILLSKFRVSYKSKYFDAQDFTSQPRGIVFGNVTSDILKECIEVISRDIRAIKQGIMTGEIALRHSCAYVALKLK